MKKLLKTFSSTPPVRVLTATSASVCEFILFRSKDFLRLNRSQHLLSVVLMMGAAFAGDRLFSELFRFVNMKSHFRYSLVYNGKGQCDMLFLGNSRGHAFYQPAIRRVTGSSTLNLSYNALPVSIARALIEDYYDHYLPPQKLIIEVSMLSRTDTAVINEFKLYAHHSKRIRSVIEECSPRTVVALSVANLYAFNTEAFQRSLVYLRKTDADWIMDKKIGAGLIAHAGEIPEMNYRITDDRMEDFMAIVRRAKAKNTEVKLVLAPFYPAFRQKIINLEDFISTIEQKTGIKVNNYAGKLTEDQYFSDYMHPNKEGSIRYIERMHLDDVL